MSLIAEYIWLDVNKTLRSKTKVIHNPKPGWLNFPGDVMNFTPQELACTLPIWNFDGSSTGQAEGLNSELKLRPAAVYNDPFRNDYPSILVLCETYDKDDNPLPSNYRSKAVSLFNKKLSSKPWFGIEQEYFVYGGHRFSGHEKQGQYYCSVGSKKALNREVAEEHLQACLKAGLTISGINAEVAPCQWEYQIGPCEGINSGDEVWVSRYLLLRVAEKQGKNIDFSPKPFPKLNGSGCHTNYSTKEMRQENGILKIYEAIDKLKENHMEHMLVYGEGNNERMSGLYETSKYDEFTFDLTRPVDRGASVRIGYDTINNGCGYFEDRRPASTMDPYMVTAKIFETTEL